MNQQTVKARKSTHEWQLVFAQMSISLIVCHFTSRILDVKIQEVIFNVDAVEC